MNAGSKAIGKVIAVLAAMLCLSCNVLKKVNTQTELGAYNESILNQDKLSSNHHLQTDQHFFEWRLDSVNRNDVVTIWPKGKFTFSPLNGFEGEAEKVVFNSASYQSRTSLKVKDSLIKKMGLTRCRCINRRQN